MKKRQWYLLLFVMMLTSGLVYAATHGTGTSMKTDHGREKAHKESKTQKAKAHGHAQKSVKRGETYVDPREAANARAKLRYTGKATEVKPKKYGFWELVWYQFWKKVDHLRDLDEHNDQLRKRIAILEVANAKLTSTLEQKNQKTRAHRIKSQSKKEGGVGRSRTIASIKPIDEVTLAKPAKAIFEHALGAFKKGAYEDSAKLLSYLTEHPEDDRYKDARTYFLTGISFYHLHNFKKAKSFLKKTITQAKGKDVAYAPRALAWLALCYKKLGQRAAENKTVSELIEKYPKSKEARRLNRRG